MQTLLSQVMDARLFDLFSRWQSAFLPTGEVKDPLDSFAVHKDNLLIIDIDGSHIRYSYYGQGFVEQFGTDLTGQVIDVLPTDILPVERRGMLEFEYTFAHRVQRPLWRSYTAALEDGETQTWQRLVLPAGGSRLVVGVYAHPPGDMDGLDDSDTATGLLRLLIERVPVVVDPHGRVQDLALSLKAFSDTQQHVAELEILATRDALTGVANLRHFHHQAALELDHARRMGRNFSLLALDIDHFKRINDTWGHATGDEALKAFVGACKLALRELDILGRCGGEEFAVALPNTGTDAAMVIADRLRQQVEQIKLPLPKGEILSFTVSVGVATAQPSENGTFPTVPALLGRADKALYRSKTEGRNRVTLAGAEDEG